MLKNINRLRKDAEIRRVFKDGKYLKSENFSLTWRKNFKIINRFAIVVSTKVEKRSARRNALKRQMREVIRITEMSIGYDIVLAAKHYPSWPLSQKKIITELEKLFSRVTTR